MKYKTISVDTQDLDTYLNGADFAERSSGYKVLSLVKNVDGKTGHPNAAWFTILLEKIEKNKPTYDGFDDVGPLMPRRI